MSGKKNNPSSLGELIATFALLDVGVFGVVEGVMQSDWFLVVLGFILFDVFLMTLLAKFGVDLK